MTPAFVSHGHDDPQTPVVISVPHAGRDYPLALRAASRVAVEALAALEDRYIDAVALAARENETTFVQSLPRAWIDLNRSEHERDPRIDEGACGAPSSAKVRIGLGLVPRRTATIGELWRRRLSGDEVSARIVAHHRPYHEAVATALERARARFGCAVLLDLHSMPPIAGGGARIVVGDRFGRAAGVRFVRRIEDAIAACGVTQARNAPYAGGHILERHGNPAGQVHAIQLEIDRTLYLDRKLDRPGGGFDRVVEIVRAALAALADEAWGGALDGAALAAE